MCTGLSASIRIACKSKMKMNAGKIPNILGGFIEHLMKNTHYTGEAEDYDWRNKIIWQCNQNYARQKQKHCGKSILAEFSGLKGVLRQSVSNFVVLIYPSVWGSRTSFWDGGKVVVIFYFFFHFNFCFVLFCFSNKDHYSEKLWLQFRDQKPLKPRV